MKTHLLTFFNHLKISGMNANKVVCLWAVFSVLVACARKEVTTTAKADHPNIVLIFMDDLGYGDLSAYGAIGYTTPNLDRMAAEGMRFTDFHAATAVCSASRAAILTGCYPDRVSVFGAYMPDAKEALHPNEVTIAEVAKSQDYKTAMFGKWHLGNTWETLPLSQGFDEYVGLPYSNDMWPVYYDGMPATEENCKTNPWKINMPELPLIEGYEKIRGIKSLDDQGILTTTYTERAVNFIQKNKNQPFFLYVAHSMPHVPLGVSEKFKGKSQRGLFGDVMMEIDWSVGEILKALKKEGLDDNTMVVFTSDNGPWLNYGNHAGSTAGLREGKGAMWEGGHRVPCIMRWPGKINAGQVSSELMITMDLFPTFTKLMGGSLPANKIDGIDMSPLIFQGKASPRDEFWGYYGGELVFVRKGKYKLTLPHAYRTYLDNPTGNDGFPGALSSRKAGIELYDLEMDPYEKTDIASSHPELVVQMMAIANVAREDLGDRITKVVGKGVRAPWKIDL